MLYQTSLILVLLVIYSYSLPIEQDTSSDKDDLDVQIHSVLVLCRLEDLCNDDEQTKDKRLSSQLFHGIPKFGKRAFSSAFAGIPKFG